MNTVRALATDAMNRELGGDLEARVRHGEDAADVPVGSWFRAGRRRLRPALASVGAILLVLLVGMATPCGAEDPAPKVNPLPAGLEAFLEACLQEAAGEYREAMDLYAEAFKLNPANQEIRVRYAAILFNVGNFKKAAEILDGQEDLDYFGLRVKAMALATLALQGEGDLNEARTVLREAVDIRTDDPNLMISLVQVEHRLGNVQEAEAVMAELRGARSGSPRLIAYHASLLEELGRLQDASELYRLCTDDFPVATRCRDALVSVLIKIGKPGEAGAALASWLEDDELDQLVRASALLGEGGRLEEGLEVIRRVLAVEPDSTPALSLKAYLLSRLNRHQEALPVFEQAIEKDPENIELLLSVAWSKSRLGDLDGARETLDRAWEIVRVDAGSARAMAVCLSAARVELANNNPMIAREWLERVATPGQAGIDFVRYLAESYRQSEQWSEGISAMLRLQPRLPDSMTIEARAFEAEFRIRLGDPEGMETLKPLLASEDAGTVLIALQVLQATDRWSDVAREGQAALERHPDNEYLLFAQASSLERLGRFDDAATAFEEVLRINPDNTAAANYLGYMWADRGVNLERALELITRAVEADPENSAYLDSLGWVYFKMGEIAKAAHWLERAVEVGPPDGTVLAHLGEVRMALGEKQEALAMLRQALGHSPEDPERIRELIDDLTNP